MKKLMLTFSAFLMLTSALAIADEFCTSERLHNIQVRDTETLRLTENYTILKFSELSALLRREESLHRKLHTARKNYNLFSQQVLVNHQSSSPLHATTLAALDLVVRGAQEAGEVNNEFINLTTRTISNDRCMNAHMVAMAEERNQTVDDSQRSLIKDVEVERTPAVIDPSALER